MSKRMFGLFSLLVFGVYSLSAQAKSPKAHIFDTIKTTTNAKAPVVTSKSVTTTKTTTATKATATKPVVTSKSATTTQTVTKTTPTKPVITSKSATTTKTATTKAKTPVVASKSAKTTKVTTATKAKKPVVAPKSVTTTKATTTTKTTTPAKTTVKTTAVKSNVVPTQYSTVKKPATTTTAKAPALTPQSSVPMSFNNQMLSEINAMRKSGTTCGGEKMPPVKALVWNVQLERAAVIHANDMDANDRFSHQGLDGSMPDDRIKAAGYEWERVGENIGQGYKDVASAIKGWKESANHCKQMMSAEVTEVGAAKKGKYWCQTFAKPLDK